MKKSIVYSGILTLSLSLTGVSNAAEKSGGNWHLMPAADQYRSCAILLFESRYSFSNPQDGYGAMINSGKLLNEWMKEEGLDEQEARKIAKSMILKSKKEIDSKEKFGKKYADETQIFCAKLLGKVVKETVQE